MRVTWPGPRITIAESAARSTQVVMGLPVHGMGETMPDGGQEGRAGLTEAEWGALRELQFFSRGGRQAGSREWGQRHRLG